MPRIFTTALAILPVLLLVSFSSLLAQPKINSISPGSAPAGAPVTISGTGFNATAGLNTVYFGTVKATVNTASETSLSVSVPVSATYGPVTVLNTGTALSATSSQYFTPLFASPAAGLNSEFYQPKLDVGVSVPAGGYPYSLTIGDLDADGLADVVTADGNSGYISLVHNAATAPGQPFFDNRFTVATGLNPVAALLKDLDGDGKPDIVTTDNAAGTISVIHSNVAGTFNPTTFSTPVSFQLGASAYPFSTAAGDINGDGKPDLVVANYATATLSLFMNQSAPGNITTASFAPKVDIPTNNLPRAIVMGDVDGDGRTDILYVSGATNTVTVLRNTGATGAITAGSLAPKVDFPTGASPTSVVLGDLDGDGKLEIVTGNYVAGTVSVLRNQSAPGTITASSFQSKIDFTAGAQLFSIAVGDADGDGKPDVVAVSAASNSLVFLHNKSTTGTLNISSFSAPLTFSTGVYPTSVALADMDQDGIPEAVALNAADHTFSVFKIRPFVNAGQPPVITALSPANGQTGSTVTITGTGFNTAATSNAVYFGSIKATVTGGGAGSLTVTVPAGAAYGPVKVLNTAKGISGSSAAAFNTTFGNPFGAGIPSNFYGPPVSFATGTLPYQFAAGDIDGDGKADLAVLNYYDNFVSVFRNTSTTGSIGAGSFAAKVDFQLGINSATAVSIADLDGDGKPELVVTSNSYSRLVVLRNTSVPGTISASSFANTPKVYATGTSMYLYPYHTAVADVDGDGRPDLVTANTMANSVAVHRNISSAGTISFLDAVPFAVSGSPRYVAVADVDGDGKPDIVTANQGQNSVSVMRNTSVANAIDANSFAAPVSFPVGAAPYAVVAGDLDGDGKAEIITVNHDANTVSVLHNSVVSGSIGAGSFAKSVDFATGAGPFHVAIGDADGDGKPDIISANASSGTVTVLRNQTAGAVIGLSSFTATGFPTGGYPLSVAFADLDGDGAGEVITSNGANTLSVLKIGMPVRTNQSSVEALQQGIRQGDNLSSRIQLYPNPTSGQFTVQLPEHKGPMVMEILDDAGKPVLRKQADAGQNQASVSITLNLTNQPSGVYYLKLTGTGGVQITRFVLQR